MKKYTNKIFQMLVCVSLIILLSCTTNIYLVRHAEKQDESFNTPLSDIGLQRADILRDSLLRKGIDSIFVSTYLRTQQTAQPLCTALNKNFVIYNIDTTLQLAQHLKKINSKNILVVGHSGNIPLMVRAIANQEVDIPDSIYNKLFIIHIHRCLKTTINLTETTYGAPTPPVP